MCNPAFIRAVCDPLHCLWISNLACELHLAHQGQRCPRASQKPEQRQREDSCSDNVVPCFSVSNRGPKLSFFKVLDQTFQLLQVFIEKYLVEEEEILSLHLYFYFQCTKKKTEYPTLKSLLFKVTYSFNKSDINLCKHVLIVTYKVMK